jgi:Ca2+-binding RTX toxin-like protein
MKAGTSPSISRDPGLVGGARPQTSQIGGPGNDQLNGGFRNDLIYGGRGNDRIRGRRGNDQLYGGPGNDLIYDGPGNDQIFGGPGNDQIFGGPGNDRIYGGPATTGSSTPRRHDRVPGIGNQPGRCRRSPRRRSGGVRARVD